MIVLNLLAAQKKKTYLFKSKFSNSFFFFYLFTLLKSKLITMIENTLKNYSITFEKILPMLRKRSKASYIAAAILLLAVQQVYSFFTPPKHLRSFPRVSFLAMIKSFYYNESVSLRNEKLVAPLMDAGHKFYVVSKIFMLK